MLKGACQLAVALSVAVFRTGGNTDLQQSRQTGHQGNVGQCASKARQNKGACPVVFLGSGDWGIRAPTAAIGEGKPGSRPVSCGL